MTAEELYNRLKSVKPGAALCTYTMEKVEKMLPLINEINELKKQQDTVILAHSYCAPEILLGVADFTGDSFKLSKDATTVQQKTILFSAVRFMGETAKILNPQKDVIIPGPLTGCSLADSITGKDVEELRKQNPDYTFVCYINTTADVKAACDVCVTSGNVMHIVETIPSDKIYFVPDALMGQNIIDEMKRRGVKKDIKLYNGCCYVHENYDPDLIQFFRSQNPNLKVISHPECNPSVAMLSDYVGSTGQMVSYINQQPKDSCILLLTECGLNARMHYEHPDMNFIGSCCMCKYMKSNSLENILEALRHPEKAEHITLDEDVRVQAKKCIDAMFKYAE
ncbi:MAG: quinolinate synthase NadA [Fibrobacter sp.]|uniref:quinolinate synthase NadA n=1 Tax=Fibrobacter sp. TaxID=35828 RepID=UPI0025C477B7|nr:quinolinate synthase NadA [Fibrobacter sp.]MBQ7081822.1 quinolinate synthase NadA [Fibrobacter sp.]MBR2091703.1 quinolinate synthase NadA [Fibrobacter sp.]